MKSRHLNSESELSAFVDDVFEKSLTVSQCPADVFDDIQAVLSSNRFYSSESYRRLISDLDMGRTWLSDSQVEILSGILVKMFPEIKKDIQRMTILVFLRNCLGAELASQKMVSLLRSGKLDDFQKAEIKYELAHMVRLGEISGSVLDALRQA